VPLIVASILSKKLAEGIDALVLDVKVGRGAFMKDLASARSSPGALVRVGRRAGKRVVALITDMNAPIGLSIGNALETREAIEVLRNEGPTDTRELTLDLGVESAARGALGELTERRPREPHARPRRWQRVRVLPQDGPGTRRQRAGGGGSRRLPRAKARVAVRARESGFVTGIDALELGLVSVALGAGRSRAEDRSTPPLAWSSWHRSARASRAANPWRSCTPRSGHAPAPSSAEQWRPSRWAGRAKRPQKRVLERIGER
jgi:pyrimidine-nucleoside phosphorylase